MRLLFARLFPLCCSMLLLALAIHAQQTPTVTITPPAGIVEEAVFDIVIAGLQPASPYSIDILFQGDVVFSSDETSDADGQINYPIVSTAGDAPGAYTLQVISETELVASASFELTAPAQPAAQVALEPASIQAGQALQIAVRGLGAFDSVTAQITAHDGVLIDTILARASIDGELRSTFSPADDLDPGEYQVDIFVDAQIRASATLTVVEPSAEPPAAEAAAITIAPQSAPIGSSHIVQVSGLRARENVTLDVTFGGDSVYRSEKTADAAGSVSVELVTDAQDAPGDYLITILRATGAQPSAILTATAKSPLLNLPRRPSAKLASSKAAWWMAPPSSTLTAKLASTCSSLLPQPTLTQPSR